MLGNFRGDVKRYIIAPYVYSKETRGAFPEPTSAFAHRERSPFTEKRECSGPFLDPERGRSSSPASSDSHGSSRAGERESERVDPGDLSGRT